MAGSQWVAEGEEDAWISAIPKKPSASTRRFVSGSTTCCRRVARRATADRSRLGRVLSGLERHVASNRLELPDVAC